MKKLLSISLAFVMLLCVGTFPTTKADAAINLYSIYLCGIIDSDGANRTGWQEKASTALANISDAVINKKTAFNSDELERYLKASKIFVVHTHGSAVSLRAVDENGEISRLYKSDIDSFASGALSGVKLAYLGACEVGAGQSNIVKSVYSKGAACVIGYTESVYTNANYIMIENFCVGIGGGYSILESLAYADAKVLAGYSSSGNTDQRLVLGDTSQIFPDRILLQSIDVNDEKEIVYFRNQDDAIVGFFDPNKLSESGQETYRISQVDEIDYNTTANEYLRSLCDNSSRYTLEKSYYTADTGLTTYIYSVKVSNIVTADILFVSMNENGELVTYGKPYEGIFDNLNLSEDQINTALQNLENLMAEKGVTEYTIEEQRVVFYNGEYTIRYSCKCIDESRLSFDDFYIALA